MDGSENRLPWVWMEEVRERLTKVDEFKISGGRVYYCILVCVVEFEPTPKYGAKNKIKKSLFRYVERRVEP